MTNHIRTLVCSVFVTLLWATPGSAEIMRLAWDANTEANVSGYRLSYGTSPGSHPTTVDVGNQTTVLLNGFNAGQRYYFVVRAYDTDGATSPPSVEISGVALGVVTLTSSALTSPIPTGAPVTWTAMASTGPTLEYQFSRQHQPSGTWTVVQTYGSQNTFTWNPQSGDVGTYVMRVWARVPGSSEEFDARRETLPFAVGNSAVVVGSVEANVALPASTGSPIVFKARASGGPAPLQYRFYRYNLQTSTWTLARDYSTADSFTWTPSSSEEGSYQFQVWVRGAGSTANYDGWRTTDVVKIKNEVPGIAKVYTQSSSPAGYGTPITWKADASGGPGPLHYRFYRLARATGTWTLAQDYGPSDTYTWTPTSAEQGTYAIQAWVRRSGQTAAYEAWGSAPDFEVTSTTPVIRSISSDGGVPVAAGAPITWTVDATGGPGPLQYGFSLYRVGLDSWSAVKAYSTSNTFTWGPGVWDAGSYVLQVSVIKPGSTSADAVGTTSFDVASVPTPTILAITRSTGSTLNPGMPIIWTVKASGGGAPLEYLFARYNAATQVWTTVQAYSWDNTYGWVPGPGDLGTYNLYAFVRRAGTTVPYEHVAYTGTFIVN